MTSDQEKAHVSRLVRLIERLKKEIADHPDEVEHVYTKGLIMTE